MRLWGTFIMRSGIVTFVSIVICSVAWGQTPSSPSSGASAGQSMPGMSDHDMSNMPMKDMPMNTDKDNGKDAENDASAHVMNSMEGHMDMGPHMKMTAL